MTDLLSSVSLWEVLGWTMLHFLWMGCIAFALAALVKRSVRRLPAQFRYSVALLCLLGVTGTAGAALFVSLKQIDTAATTARPAWRPPDPAENETGPPLPPAWMQLGTAPAWPAAPPAHEGLTPAEALRHEFLHGTLNLCAQLLPWLWVCGTPLVILALLTGILGTTRLRRRSSEVTDEQLHSQLQQIRTLLGITRRVGIAVCDQVSSPLVIGILRPLIVLPPSMISGLAPAQLEMILLHELAHVRRWDNLVNLLQRAIEALLFYHPAVWWASRWVRLEREHCCDALVLSHDHTPQSYAETLATLALPELAPQFATAAMANHQLTSRICHILNVEERTMSISLRTVVGGVVLLAAGVGGFLLATLRSGQVVAEDPETPAVRGLDLIAEEEGDLTGRLMSGVGVNSDAGLVGRIALNDEEEMLLGMGVVDGQVIGEDLANWGRRAWSASEATGPPDVPEAGDSPQAWASLTEDGQAEWLKLTFEKPVRAAAVIVYESFNPGALHRVTTVDSDGSDVVVWEGEDPVAVQEGRGVSIVMPPQPMELSEITLHLKSSEVEGWNEIDAVGLIDGVTGEVHWATSAEASSSYADRAALIHGYHHHHFAGGYYAIQQCETCHANAHGHPAPGSSRERIDQLRSLLQRLEVELAHEEALRAQVELENQLRTPEAGLAEEDARRLAEWLRRGVESDGESTPAETDGYQEWVRRLLNDPRAGAELSNLWWRQAWEEWPQPQTDESADGASDEATRFDELRQTLREQQQAIERLADVLEQLQQRLETPADGTDGESGADGHGVRMRIPAMGPDPLGFDFALPQESDNAIDELLRERWRRFGIEDEGDVSDEQFIRRVYLDLLGRPPTVEELKSFLENESSTSRQELIDRLLETEDPPEKWNEAWSFYLGIER